MNISSKRAEYTALVGIGVSVIFFVLTWIMAGVAQSYALSTLKWLILGSLIVAVVLWFQFRLRSMAQQEKLDLDKIDNEQEANIFAEQGSNVSMFAVAQKRLDLFEKWYLPAFSVIIAAYHIIIGIIFFNKAFDLAALSPESPQTVAVILFFMAFGTFLIAKYASGLSGQKQWRPIRAYGSWLLVCSVLTFLIAVAMGLAQFKYMIMHTVLGWAVPVVMLIIGAETALNIVFDIYRPRISGQYHRASFDSRLLGLFSEPGGFFHSIAAAIDYQFGFQVSQTWFYQLVQKAIVPLVFLSILLLWLMSGFLVIGPGQQAIIERFGKPLNNAEPIGPGLRLKLPYPIDIAYLEDVQKVQFIPVGYTPKHNQHIDKAPLLWGRPHYEAEENLLVGSKTKATDSGQGAGAFGMVVTAVPLHYRIKNLNDYIYNNAEPEKTLSAIAHRELTKFAVSAKVETSDDDDVSADSILGAGRTKANKTLKQRIQQAADEKGLGVEIVFAAMEGVHPPKEVAEDYQKVVGAVQQSRAAILGAMADRNTTLAKLGGSVDKVNDMYQLGEDYILANTENNDVEAEKIASEFDEKIKTASGEIYRTLSQAKSYSYEKAAASKADGERFQSQLMAYELAPEIYLNELRLGTLEEMLNDIRKYVVIADANDSQILIFDLKEKLEQSLYDIEIPEGN